MRYITTDGHQIKASKMSKKTQSIDEDVHICYEDQSKINKFAINNTKLHDFQDDLVEKNKELTNLNEAIDELVILDETEMIPFQYGEIFTHLSVEEANQELERSKKGIEDEINSLEDKVKSTKKVLSDLKTQLYAKFGNKINLEESD
ncbi:prefoldin subunit 4 [Brachionus plicatilis]|uniref:Prefoldin subunit 4 n=1 Tax=Brachionus plicatilis TaxID=10195 RepID=A0A3M7Q2F1_BRAPC|nr:prefoldin subunit 4 [Brachionus plicatilis]